MSDLATNTGLQRSMTAGARVFQSSQSARIIDATLMGLVIVRVDAPWVPISVPFAQVAMIALLCVVVFRRPARSLERVRWFPAVAMALLAYLAFVSVVQDVDFFRRLGNIALLFIVAGFLASGRIDVASAIKGIGMALAVNAALFYLGVAPDTYGGVLTGYLSDKNAAGLVYGIGALLLTLTVHRWWLRLAVFVLGAGALVLTDSRTSMAAYAAAGAWILLSSRLGVTFKAILGIAIAAAFLWIDRNYSDAGRYAQIRAGSDALRDRIDTAAEAKIAVTPWYGGGLGEATTEVEGIFWFFHNSYDALYAEGGIVVLVTVVALYIVVGFGLPISGRTGYPITAVSAATLFLLLAATRLGEVFFAPIGLILLGVGLALIVEHDPFVRDTRIHAGQCPQRGATPASATKLGE